MDWPPKFKEGRMLHGKLFFKETLIKFAIQVQIDTLARLEIIFVAPYVACKVQVIFNAIFHESLNNDYKLVYDEH